MKKLLFSILIIGSSLSYAGDQSGAGGGVPIKQNIMAAKVPVNQVLDILTVGENVFTPEEFAQRFQNGAKIKGGMMFIDKKTILKHVKAVLTKDLEVKSIKEVSIKE